MSILPKILVVDDDPDIVEILRYNLSLAGYEVKSAANGKEAIKKAKLFIPQIILLDIMMPEMDGIEACSQIKGIPSLDNTMIIFLSARSEDFTQIAAFDAGGDDYISKLLFLLASKPGKVFTRDEIMNSVWGSQVIVGNRTIDVHIRKLREKIGDSYFKTIKGVGYKFTQ